MSKSIVVLSSLFVAFANIRKLELDKIVQACESVQNDREVISKGSEGTVNNLKTGFAESEELTKLRTKTNVVTAFIEWAEADKGKLDATAKRAEKQGLAVTLTDVPATFKGQGIGEWVSKFVKPTEEEAKAKAESEAKAKAEADAKAKADAKEAIEQTKAQVAKGKAKAKPEQVPA